MTDEIGEPAPSLTPPPLDEVSAPVVARWSALGYDHTDQSPT